MTSFAEQISDRFAIEHATDQDALTEPTAMASLQTSFSLLALAPEIFWVEEALQNHEACTTFSHGADSIRNTYYYTSKSSLFSATINGLK